MLTADNALFVAVDFQERLMPSINNSEEVLRKAEILTRGLKAIGLPIIFTQQYTKGLGETVSSIKSALDGVSHIEKISFGCCGEPKFLESLEAAGRKNIIVAGVESHVCVQQTVLALIEMGYTVYLAADCAGSRFKADQSYAEKRMLQAGCVVTTMESILFELLKSADHPKRKEISNLIK